MSKGNFSCDTSLMNMINLITDLIAEKDTLFLHNGMSIRFTVYIRNGKWYQM